MKKTKLLTLMAFSLVFALQSCKDNFSDDFANNAKPDVQVVGDRLSFKDSKTFYTTLTSLSKMPQGQFNAWRHEHKFPALYNRIDSLGVNKLKTLPYWFQALMNESGELIIGDTIVWYSQTGDIHYVPKFSETDLVKIKSGTANSAKKDIWSVSPVQFSPEKMARVNVSGIDARWQHQFYFNQSSGSIRKFVFELQNVRSANYSTLMMNMKAEWYGNSSHTWNTAGELRQYYWDVHYNATLKGPFGNTIGFTFDYQLNGTWSDTQNHPIELVTIYGSGGSYWDVDVQGTLYESMADTVYPYIVNDYGAPDTGTTLW